MRNKDVALVTLQFSSTEEEEEQNPCCQSGLGSVMGEPMLRQGFRRQPSEKEVSKTRKLH